MGNIALSTSLQDVSAYGPQRRFTLLGSSDAVVVLRTGRLVGSTSFGTVMDPADPSKPLVLKGASMTTPEINEPSSFLKYEALSGSVTSCYMEAGGAPINIALTVATASVLGASKLSVAPVSAAAPIAVGDNDARVTQIEVPVNLSASDGSLAEQTVWIPGVAATIVSASLSAPANIAQSDTNYLTFTLGIRDGAGGSASTVASQVSKASGASFLAFEAVSLGTVGNATTTATSHITFKSVKTAAGQASGPALLRITYTVP